MDTQYDVIIVGAAAGSVQANRLCARSADRVLLENGTRPFVRFQ